jgi:ligand-binding sensor domain-containing protein
MRYSLVWILLFFYSSIQGQQLLFENYSSEQGLSQNSCYTITQDEDGFMWFGTQDGLNRYDGKRFRIFLPQNPDGKKLPSNYISSLFFDHDQHLLWVGTIRGACIYLPSGDSLLRITELFPWAGVLETASIKKIQSFRTGEYWILTFNKGLLRLDTKHKQLSSYFNDETNRIRVNSILIHQGKLVVAVAQQLFRLQPYGNDYLVQPIPSKQTLPEIRELFSFRGRLWLGTQTEGCLYAEGPLDDLVFHPFTPAAGGIGCFMTNTNGELWIGTRGNGLVVYNPDSNSAKYAVHSEYDERSLGKNFVLSLFKDRQNIIWCGLSGSGVAKYDPLKYQFRTISNDPLNPYSLPDNMVFDLYRCRNGKYYAGTQNKGLAEWDPASNEFYTYPESAKFGAVANTIYDITSDDRNTIWIASWGGLMSLDRQNRKLNFDASSNHPRSKRLYALTKLKNADSLFITGENGPAFFSLKEKKWLPGPVDFMQAESSTGRFIYEDNNHVLWICTIGAGLIRYDYRKGDISVVKAVKPYSISVRHLLQSGSLFWLATDNGVVIYDPVNQKIVKHLILQNTGASNVCYAIQEDKQGFFWISTNTGLYRVDPNRWNGIRNYDLGNGLSFLEYNTACALSEADGTLIFGGTGGITRFNPALLKENRFSPPPIITSVDVDDQKLQTNQPVSRLPKLVLSHRQNFITIHFAANNFSNPNKNHFSYRLKGLNNNNWTDAGNRGFANYTALPPGDYVFELSSSNSDGIVSNQVTSLVIIINHPWWQTWWFRVSLILVIAGIVTIMVRRRIALIRHEARLKQQIAETEMMALRAQMNPHFIFNCINSIDALIQSNDKYHATVYLNKFARLIRNILDSSKQNLVTLSKDLETLRLYIELEQFRTENKFSASIDAESSLLEENYKVPPLIIQPFVENAILHGLRNKPGNEGLLDITVKHVNDHIQYIIEDNGVGRQAGALNGYSKQKKSYGVEMSLDRIKLFNEQENASVTITDLYDNNRPAGTRVKVDLKLQS